MEKRRQITYITRRQIIDRLLLDDVEPFYGKSELIPFLKRNMAAFSNTFNRQPFQRR